MQGGNGGSLSIAAPAMALDGSVLGNTVAGALQRQTPPATSSLSLSFQSQDPSGIFISPTPPDIIFQGAANQSLAAPFTLDGSGNPVSLPQDRQSLVILSPDLTSQDGFGALLVNDGDGDISIPANVTLAAPALGSITLDAANLDIEGNISAPGGTLDFIVNNISPYASIDNSPPLPNAGRGQFVLGASASLSTSGLIIDDLPGSTTANILPLVVNGGSITINSYSADLAAGSLVDVSGGVSVSASNKVTFGKGGKIAISAGSDPNSNATLGGKLILDARCRDIQGRREGP